MPSVIAKLNVLPTDTNAETVASLVIFRKCANLRRNLPSPDESILTDLLHHPSHQSQLRSLST